jgi:hypothetical protein
VPTRADVLVEQLHAASEALITLIEAIEPTHWLQVPRGGVWSPSKDAEHVAEGNALHQWHIRQSLGHKAGRRPAVNRDRLVAERAHAEVVELLRLRTEDSVGLISSLTDEQLDLPMRTRTGTVGDVIERTLIGHFDTHRVEIEAKLDRLLG